jgi:hypothetical protein
LKQKPRESASAEKAHLQNLKEDLEIEEEFASIFGLRRFATQNTEIYSDK